MLDFEWDEFIGHLTGINWWLFILAAVLYYVSFWFRGWRWQLIYKSVANRSENPELRRSEAPSIRTLSALILTGWFVNSVMFFRIGDAYRGWAWQIGLRAICPRRWVPFLPNACRTWWWC